MTIQDYSNRTILITGCSTGIGLATARRLKHRGYNVLTTARKPVDIAELQLHGFYCRFMDYTLPQSITETVQWALAQGQGRIYGLFNNGAYGQPGAVEDLSRDVLREQFEANFFGWHQLTTEVLAEMRKVNEGRIIQNSSVLGIVPMKMRGAYNASKYAIEGLTDTLRLELKGSNIFISLIEPGPIYSEFRRNAYKHFKRAIMPQDSFHRQTYEAVEARLSDALNADSRFTLPPEAVAEKVIHALESSRPRARYPVTFPTHLFGYLKRLLPTSWLDFILNKAG